jgi:hypothetical protein
MNMIDIGVLESWLLIVLTFLVLAALWSARYLTFNLIDRAHEHLRATELSLERQEARVRGDGSSI